MSRVTITCNTCRATYEVDDAAEWEREHPGRCYPQPVEPTGDGYIYVAIVLHNGAELAAKRAPNRRWWWEVMPASGPGAESCGSWDEMLDHIGRTLPLEVVRLIPARDWPCPNPDDPEGCYCLGDGPCLIAGTRE